MSKELKKISLPIELDESDTIRPRNPALKWLGRILITLIVILSLVYFISESLSRILVSHIDLATEKQLFQHSSPEENEKKYDIANLETIKNFTGDIDTLRNLDNIFIVEDSIENAYATLGGKISITNKLLEKAETEEEILFILGHERAHIENRDVLIDLARTTPISLTLKSLGLGEGLINIESIIYNKFSREAEYKADEGGFEILANLGLNSECASQFFKNHTRNFEKFSEIISTHPDTNLRLKNLISSNLHPEKPCTPIKK